MKFSEIIGNKEIKNKLYNAIKENNLVHSYMFVGKQGIGKNITATEFARMILCKNNDENCRDCESCVKFNSLNHPDFIKINPDSERIKISQIRELIDSIYRKPIISNKKVIIINDADTMTEEAQNSLLKTLEEPPEYIVIILITSNINLLLNTIRSRCIKINFNDISKKEIKDFIEKNSLFDTNNQNLVNLCNGSIGKTFEVSERIEEYNQIDMLINNIFNKNNNQINSSLIDIVKSSEILYKSKENINNILDYIIICVYSMLNDNKLSIEKAQNIVYEIEETKRRIKYNSNFDMSIDRLLFKIKEQL